MEKKSRDWTERFNNLKSLKSNCFISFQRSLAVRATPHLLCCRTWPTLARSFEYLLRHAFTGTLSVSYRHSLGSGRFVRCMILVCDIWGCLGGVSNELFYPEGGDTTGVVPKRRQRSTKPHVTSRWKERGKMAARFARRSCIVVLHVSQVDETSGRSAPGRGPHYYSAGGSMFNECARASYILPFTKYCKDEMGLECSM